MTIKVFPYRAGSRGARALADALEARVLRREVVQNYRRTAEKVLWLRNVVTSW
jgi:hypothetical protein